MENIWGRILCGDFGAVTSDAIVERFWTATKYANAITKRKKAGILMSESVWERVSSDDQKRVGSHWNLNAFTAWIHSWISIGLRRSEQSEWASLWTERTSKVSTAKRSAAEWVSGASQWTKRATEWPVKNVFDWKCALGLSYTVLREMTVPSSWNLANLNDSSSCCWRGF